MHHIFCETNFVLYRILIIASEPSADQDVEVKSQKVSQSQEKMGVSLSETDAKFYYVLFLE